MSLSSCNIKIVDGAGRSDHQRAAQCLRRDACLAESLFAHLIRPSSGAKAGVVWCAFWCVCVPIRPRVKLSLWDCRRATANGGRMILVNLLSLDQIEPQLKLNKSAVRSHNYGMWSTGVVFEAEGTRCTLFTKAELYNLHAKWSIHLSDGILQFWNKPVKNFKFRQINKTDVTLLDYPWKVPSK